MRVRGGLKETEAEESDGTGGCKRGGLKRGGLDERGVKKDENWSRSFIQATKEAPTMKNLDNNLHRRATRASAR